MKQPLCILSLIFLVLCSCSKNYVSEYGTKYQIVDNCIVTEVPQRPHGQENVLGLAVDPIPVVRVGFIGLGMRGPGAVERFTHIPDVKIVGLCDVESNRVANCQRMLLNKGLEKAYEYSGEDGWIELCNRDDIDLIYIATDWKNHAKMAIYAMEHGKHVAIEVPAAMNMQEIWALINTSERTRKHCMQLENCVYDFFELTTLNMAQHNVFGEILRAEGAYIHNLNDFWGEYWNNWRLDYNRNHRGDVYPTHGIGPICQALNIHRGDKLNYLVSVDTKAVSAPEYIKNTTGETVTDFKNGDHTTTLIRTELGKNIEIQHNVVCPQPYSRKYQLTGTRGFANKYPIEGYALDSKNNSVITNHEDLSGHSFVSNDVKYELMQQYKHPIHRQLEQIARKVGGHGGMDFVMDYRLVHCLQQGLPLDMDVYDLAEWCCLTELSGLSLEHGSIPVKIPDFTRGYWNELQGLKFAE